MATQIAFALFYTLDASLRLFAAFFSLYLLYCFPSVYPTQIMCYRAVPNTLYACGHQTPINAGEQVRYRGSLFADTMLTYS